MVKFESADEKACLEIENESLLGIAAATVSFAKSVYESLLEKDTESAKRYKSYIICCFSSEQSIWDCKIVKRRAKLLSKFEYEYFCGNCLDYFAVSKQKFTKEQAVDIAKYELGFLDSKYLAIGNGYVRHRAGVSEDNEPCVGWWLEYEEHKRSCPCWVFHTTNNPDEWCNKDYEYIGYGENNA